MRRSFQVVGALAASLLVTVVGIVPSASADGTGDPARGTIKIEETELSDADPPNEVKVGCDFSIEFFGMEEGEVPLTFTLMPPSGDSVVRQTSAQVNEAQGNELSGSLDVDLTDDLREVPPADAEDFDYKVRVDAEVKSSPGNESITKSAVLFIVCPAAVQGDDGATDDEAPAGGDDTKSGTPDPVTAGGAASGGHPVADSGTEVPVGGVSAGQGGMSSDGSEAWWLGAIALLLLCCAGLVGVRQRA